MFFPSATEEEVQMLSRVILYSTHLKNFPGRSAVIYNSVMSSSISHEVGVYLLAAVKFAFSFFPKEQYAGEYLDVHKVLNTDPGSQRKLDPCTSFA